MYHSIYSNLERIFSLVFPVRIRRPRRRARPIRRARSQNPLNSYTNYYSIILVRFSFEKQKKTNGIPSRNDQYNVRIMYTGFVQFVRMYSGHEKRTGVLTRCGRYVVRLRERETIDSFLMTKLNVCKHTHFVSSILSRTRVDNTSETPSVC